MVVLKKLGVDSFTVEDFPPGVNRLKFIMVETSHQ
jgi:hypothetical protein